MPDGSRIEPVPAETLHGAVMETYADHRMATFAAMLGLRIPDIEVINVATTRKTLPDFVGMSRWHARGGQGSCVLVELPSGAGYAGQLPLREASQVMGLDPLSEWICPPEATEGSMTRG